MLQDGLYKTHPTPFKHYCFRSEHKLSVRLHSLLADLRKEFPRCDHALLALRDLVEQVGHSQGEGARGFQMHLHRGLQ